MEVTEDRKYLLLALAVGVVIRSIPNLITPHPIGYDTIYYMTQILDWRRNLSNPNIIFETPLHLLILSPIYIATGLDLSVIFRIAQPLLYGLLAISFYYAARKLFKWEPKQAFLATIIFCLQTATLRISWDLLRNELGLVILLFTLPKLKNHDREGLAYIILSTLVVLSHQTTSVILLFTTASFIVNYVKKKDYKKCKNLCLLSIPSAILFAGMLFYGAGLLHIPFTPSPSIFTRIISIPIEKNVPFPFVNYLAGDGLVDYGQSYVYLLADVILFYIASYVLILPFVVKGFRSLRERTMDSWTGFCGFASLMCLVTPQFAFLQWDRWMQLLVVPYSFYATNGIIKISCRKIFEKSPKNLAIIVSIIYVITAILYMTTPYTNPVSSYAAIWPSSKYSPPTMLSHTAPIEDTLDIRFAFQWLNENMDRNACLLTRDAFVSWAKIYLNREKTVIYYQNKYVSTGLQYAKAFNYTNIYWIWWENGVGLKWYGQEMSDEFKPIYKSGNIVVYKYTYY